MMNNVYELLSELQDKVTLQTSILNEHQRRLDNIIIPGKVKTISDDGKRVTVTHGSCTTPEVKWLTESAGDVIEYRAPSIGEQVLLLNLTGGKDTSKCIALAGLTSVDFPFKDPSPDIHTRHYPDGTKVSYNHSEKRLKLELAGSADIIAAENTSIRTTGKTEITATDVVNVTSEKEIKATAPKVILNSNGSQAEEALNLNNPCIFSGGKHAPCGNQVFIGKG